MTAASVARGQRRRARWCSLRFCAMTTLQITIRNQLSELGRVCDLVSTLERTCHLPAQLVFDLNVVLDELLSNIINYGYDDKLPHEIGVTLSADDAAVEVRIDDDGKAFNPLAAPEPDLTLPLTERPIGGLGLHFVRKLMDDVHYRREDNHNHMFLKKKF